MGGGWKSLLYWNFLLYYVYTVVKLLTLKQVKTKRYGFLAVVPTIWNTFSPENQGMPTLLVLVRLLRPHVPVTPVKLGIDYNSALSL